MNKYAWVLDAGHGGVDGFGNYTTDPKKGKRCDYEDGFTILEGVINRAIAKKVREKLTFLEIDHSLVYHDVQDWTLGERCQYVNYVVNKEKRPVIFLSLHSNAGKGKGFEVFTSIGQDSSDVIATVFCEEIMRSFPDFPLRTDKADDDLDKESDFYVLRPDHNHAAARVLLENLFFDTRSEADFLASAEGQQKIADYIVRAIVWIENNVAI